MITFFQRSAISRFEYCINDVIYWLITFFQCSAICRFEYCINDVVFVLFEITIFLCVVSLDILFIFYIDHRNLDLTYLVIFVSVVLFCKTMTLSSFMYLTSISITYFCRICISGSIKTLTNGITINIRIDKCLEIFWKLLATMKRQN